MTKQFCDLCGEPAVHSGTMTFKDCGEKWVAYCPSLSTKQPQIRTMAQFTCHDHPKGWDSVDLCAKCQVKLLDDLINRIAQTYGLKIQELK